MGIDRLMTGRGVEKDRMPRAAIVVGGEKYGHIPVVLRGVTAADDPPSIAVFIKLRLEHIDQAIRGDRDPRGSGVVRSDRGGERVGARTIRADCDPARAPGQIGRRPHRPGIGCAKMPVQTAVVGGEIDLPARIKYVLFTDRPIRADLPIRHHNDGAAGILRRDGNGPRRVNGKEAVAVGPGQTGGERR